MAPPHPLAVMAEVRRLAQRPLWPGFDPGRIPIALFDGEQTWLFGHPAPPAEFSPAAALPASAPEHSADSVHVCAGRHAQLVAHTCIELHGVPTAAFLLDRGPEALTRCAVIVTHEAFHGHQRLRHPDWGANEADALLYPVDDADLLALRRQESEALRRALASAGPDRTGRAATAMAARRERFARLPETSVAYERDVELVEGLAQYVERRADGGPPRIPADGFPADGVRPRGYDVGHALGVLLDEVDPGWKDALEAGPTAFLDERLTTALTRTSVRPREFSPAELDAMAERAKTDVTDLREQQDARRRAFESRSGWRLTVMAESEPLWPAGFDPMNLHLLGGGDVLHARMIQLANSFGRIEVFDLPAVTAAAGPHPLFTGVRALTVAGLDGVITPTASGGEVEIVAPGCHARFRQAVVEGEHPHVHVTTGGAKPFHAVGG